VNQSSNDVSQYTIGTDGSLIPMATPAVGTGATPWFITSTGRFQ